MLGRVGKSQRVTTQQSAEHYNQGAALQAKGDIAGAIARYEEAVRLWPQFAEAWSNLGNAYRQAGRRDDALAAYEAAIRAKPDFAAAYCNLGVLLIELLRYDDAVKALESAIRLAPGMPEAHANLGQAFRRMQRYQEAIAASRSAIALRPQYRDAYLNLGAASYEIDDFDEALRANQRASQIDPGSAQAWCNLSSVFHATGRFQEAIAASRSAIELRPQYRDAYLNLGAASYEIDDFDEALRANQRASQIDPGRAQAWCNLSGIYHATGRFQEAIAASERAIALRPDYVEAHAHRALSLLLTGDFRRAWREYPWIWRLPSRAGTYPYLDRFPLWDGGPFAGRHLVVTREQGFGDAILMARYFPAIKALGGTLAVEIAPALASLFGSVAGIDELRIVKEPIVPRADVDLQIPLMGLPAAFGTEVDSIPANVPYLHADPERLARWTSRLGCNAKLRAGVTWAGNPGQGDDRHRSCRLADFEPLAAVEGVAWFGLQKGRDEDLRESGAFRLDPLGREIEDFADTAAIMTVLDLIVTVDTSPAHLAGALGRPVWTLLPFIPHWSYLLEREDSLWYPTMRLFRPQKPGDWPGIFRNVERELRALVLGRQRGNSNML